MKKMMFLVGILALLVCAGCGRTKEVQESTEESVEIKIPTPDPTELPKPPTADDFNEGVSTTDKLPDTPQPEEKRMAEVNGLKFLTGYDAEPILLDSYGDWRDDCGKKVPKKVVRQIFQEVPEYGYNVMRWNEDLTELMTDQRTKVLTRFQKLVAPAKGPVDEALINRFEAAWIRLEELGKLLELVSPEANGAYELCNEILNLDPESVPLYRAEDAWYDQDWHEMPDKEVKKWLKQYPECADQTKQLGELTKLARTDVHPTPSHPLALMIWLSFREGYASHYQALVASGATPPYDDDYGWWAERLTKILGDLYPSHSSSSSSPDVTLDETPLPEEGRKTDPKPIEPTTTAKPEKKSSSEEIPEDGWIEID